MLEKGHFFWAVVCFKSILSLYEVLVLVSAWVLSENIKIQPDGVRRNVLKQKLKAGVRTGMLVVLYVQLGA